MKKEVSISNWWGFKVGDVIVRSLGEGTLSDWLVEREIELTDKEKLAQIEELVNKYTTYVNISDLKEILES